MIADVIRANGERESIDLPKAAQRHLGKIIEADETDVINLRDSRLMVVNVSKDAPLNLAATDILKAALHCDDSRIVHGDAIVLLDDEPIRSKEVVRLLKHLAGYGDEPIAKILLSAAKTVDVTTARLLAVIRTLSMTLHEPSAEPCAVCEFVSRVTGEAFGCQLVPHEVSAESEVEAAWQYPMKEHVDALARRQTCV